MSDLASAPVIADVDLADTVMFPVRKGAATGLLQGTFGKLKTYLKAALKSTDFSDVDISTPPTNGQVMAWNTTAGKFKPVTTGATGFTPGYDLSVPSAASFSTASGDATNLILADDSDVGITVDCGAPVSGLITRLAYKALTTKANAWELRVKLSTLNNNTASSGMGVYLMDSVSGRTIMFCTARDDGVASIGNWTSLSAFSSWTWASNFNKPLTWLRIVHDGTNYIFYVSSDGKLWKQCYTTTNTAWLTNKADRICIGGYTNTATLPGNTMTLHYWNLSGPAV